MDFSKVKEWLIPEGKVKSVSVGGVVIWKAEAEVVEQLTAPIISLDGDTLTMTATDDRTEEFAILVDGVETATVETPKEETYAVSGTWVFNETIEVLADEEIPVSFYSDGEYFVGIARYTNALQYKNSNDSTYYYVYDGTIEDGSWFDERYREVIFEGEQEVSKEFYDWFTANAVRQTITFTIGTVSYTALSGMTWGEWVESEYNTDGYYIFNGFLKASGGRTVNTPYPSSEAVIDASANYSYTKEHEGPGGKE